MTYIKAVLQFITDYDFIILPVISLVLVCFGVINWTRNVYRKQNKKLTACARKIASYPHKTNQYATAMLPAEYKRQWRAYVNGKAEKPSLTFEFAPVKNSICLVRLFVLAAIVSVLYVVAFAFDLSRRDYIVFKIFFWLGFSLSMVVNKLLFIRKERKAKQIFARFVAELNRYADCSKDSVAEIEETVKKLQQLKKCEVSDAVLCKASSLLRDKGLNTDRSAAQQRKLNAALNGLLQSYSRSESL